MQRETPGYASINIGIGPGLGGDGGIGRCAGPSDDRQLIADAAVDQTRVTLAGETVVAHRRRHCSVFRARGSFVPAA